MQNKQFDNPEHWAGEVLGDAITGGYYTLARNVSLVLTKILAAIGLVLLRHRFGKHFITLGTLFWSGSLVGILYLLAGVSASLVAATCTVFDLSGPGTFDRPRGRRKYAWAQTHPACARSCSP